MSIRNYNTVQGVVDILSHLSKEQLVLVRELILEEEESREQWTQQQPSKKKPSLKSVGA